MEIPEEVEILGQWWEVEIVDLAGEFGNCDTFNRRIQLNRGNTPSQMASTLLHEVIHAGLHVSGLSEVFPTTEEAICMALENVLHQAGWRYVG